MPINHFRPERDAIRDLVEAEGVNGELNSYVGSFGTEEVEVLCQVAARSLDQNPRCMQLAGRGAKGRGPGLHRLPIRR